MDIKRYACIAITAGIGAGGASVAALAQEPGFISYAQVYPTSTELKNSWHIGAIKASYAWSLGADGANVKVGVLDTGVFNHTELNGRVLAGYDYVTNRSLATGTSSDDNGHGTHVAGLIAASAGSGNTVGVAPAAAIIPIKVMDSKGSGTLTNLVRGLDYSRSAGAQIVNMSLGWDGISGDASVASALQRSVNAGQLVVAAAGNSGLATSSWPARYAKETWANGQILAVGAVDQSNTIASWSNRAGDVANFYLVAPGVSIWSTYNKANTYAQMSGTSMATPIVAGAAALIKSYWSYLSAKSIGNILLSSATDLGTPGVDSIYGHGLLNLQQAMQPSGTSTVPSKSGSSLQLTRMLSSAPIAYRSVLSTANLKVAAVDDFGRDYQYDLSGLYASRKKVKSLMLSQAFSGMDARMRMTETVMNGARMTFTQIEAPERLGFSDTPLAANPVLASMTYTQKLAAGDAMSLGVNASPNRFFGFAGTPFESAGFMSDKAFANPYLAFNGYQNYVGYAMPLANGWAVSAGLVNDFDPLAMQGDSANALNGRHYNGVAQSTNASFMEVAHNGDGAHVAVAIGATREQQGLLGGSPGSVFGINDMSSTTFLSIAAARQLGSKLWLAGAFNYGASAAGGQQESLVTSVDAVRSQSWSLGLMRSDALRKGDRLGFAVSQPMAVTAGSMSLTVPVGMDAEGLMQYEPRGIPLAAKDLEHDFEASYFTPTAGAAGISLAAIYRMHPDHNAAAEDQKMLAMRWQANF